MSYSLRTVSGLGKGILAMGLLCGCSSSTRTAQFVASNVAAKSKPSLAATPVAAAATPTPAGAGEVVKLSTVSPMAAAPAPASPRPLNVMTVNLQHHDKPIELATVASHLKADERRTPDFIFCQEVLFQRGGAEDSTAAVLARELGYHVRGTKRTSDREGIAIVSKYPIEFYDSINLASQTSRLLLGFRRVSTMAETTVPGVGLVRLVNVHFTNWGFEARVRRNQLKETLEWAAARERKKPAALTFLAGDFNAEPDFAEMALIKDRSVTGPLAFHDSNGTAFSQGSHGSPDKRIDFIFVSGANLPDFTGEELLWKSGVPTPDGGSFYLSDHLALMHHYLLAPAATPAAPKGRTIITAAPLAPVSE
jgi:endonuclease/exonuclease/phosphatase family metal-dependent hydrolase